MFEEATWSGVARTGRLKKEGLKRVSLKSRNRTKTAKTRNQLVEVHVVVLGFVGAFQDSDDFKHFVYRERLVRVDLHKDKERIEARDQLSFLISRTSLFEISRYEPQERPHSLLHQADASASPTPRPLS